MLLSECMLEGCVSGGGDPEFRQGCQISWAGATVGCEMPNMGAGTELGSLEKHQALLTA